MIDEIDQQILRHLSADGRASHRELGKAVGLSPNAAGARMARLIDQGVITGVHAAIDPAALGRPLEVTIDIWLEQRPNDDTFLELAVRDDRIVETIHITGPVDYRVLAHVASPEDLDNLLATMRREGAVNQTDSRIVMRRLPTA